MESDIAIEKQNRLRDIFLKYVVALIVFILLCLFSYFFFSSAGMPLFVLYLIFGIYLTKTCLSKLIEFHPVWDTIDNNVGIRIRAILFWPFFYLILLIKLGFLHVMR